MANNSAFGVSNPCTSCLGRSITTHKRDTNAYYTSIAPLFNPSSRIIRTDEKTGSETHDCHMIRITRQGLNLRQEQQGKLTQEKKKVHKVFIQLLRTNSHTHGPGIKETDKHVSNKFGPQLPRWQAISTYSSPTQTSHMLGTRTRTGTCEGC
jgi:hypothetical protein